jgi:hypothetical protein
MSLRNNSLGDCNATDTASWAWHALRWHPPDVFFRLNLSWTLFIVAPEPVWLPSRRLTILKSVGFQPEDFHAFFSNIV